MKIMNTKDHLIKRYLILKSKNYRSVLSFPEIIEFQELKEKVAKQST